jgi:amino acid adenylation domain-containing protein
MNKAEDIAISGLTFDSANHFERDSAIKSSFNFTQRRNQEMGNGHLSFTFTLDPTNSPELIKISEQSEAASFIALLSSLAIVLNRYVQSELVVINIPDLSNDLENKKEALFPIQIKINKKQSLKELLKMTQETVKESYREHERSPKFTTSKKIESNVSLRMENLHSSSSHFQDQDVSIICAKSKGEITISVHYRVNRFETFFIDSFSKHLIICLSYLKDTSASIESIDVLTNNERKKLLIDFNANAKDYGGFETLIGVFNEQVRIDSSRMALAGDKDLLTYGQLDEKSNKLANQLTHLGVKQKDTVAVMLDRCADWIVTLFGIWKTGAVYVPIDPQLPEGRKEYILKDADIKLLVTCSDYMFDVSSYSGEILAIDIQVDFDFLESTAFPIQIQQTDIAYLIYTSGSTGNPKGIPIKHESILDRILYHNDYLGITDSDRVLQMASIAFDASLVEVFMPLCAGGVLVISSNKQKNDTNLLIKLLETFHVSLAIFPPAYLKALNKCELPSIQKIISTGEAASIEDVAFYANSIEIYNGYGPTETCIGATFYKVLPNKIKEYAALGSIPIGKPFANTNVYLLDNNYMLTPIGLPGEICVGGKGLSPGYLNNEDLTNERFIDVSFSYELEPQRIYRTGDLGRFTSDGELEFLDRIDNQIQINGIRVELGEIERRIAEVEGVNKVVINVRSLSSGKLIVAIINAVPRVTEEHILSHLSKILPAYMIPNRFIFLDKIPLTVSGKTDWQAIKGLEDDWKKSTLFILPSTDSEVQLAEMLKRILDVEKIGATSDFFTMGGNSLKAIQWVSEINEKMGAGLEVKDVFDNPTIRSLALFLEKHNRSDQATIGLVALADYYPASFAQKQSWDYLTKQNRFNAAIPGKFTLEGNLSMDAFMDSLKFVIKRHESLRTVFVQVNDDLFQKILSYDDVNFQCHFHDFSNENNCSERIETLMQLERLRGFDLERGPLIRTSLIKVDTEKHVFILVLNHIISDGASMNIFFEELAKCYNAFVTKSIPILPSLNIQYKDVAWWQKQLMQDGGLAQFEGFFQRKLAGADSALTFNHLHSFGETMAGVEKYNYKIVTAESFQFLLDSVKEKKATLFAHLVAVVNLFIYQVTGKDDILIGIPMAGRQLREVENLIGLFSSSLILRTKIADSLDFNHILTTTKDSINELLSYQTYSIDMIEWVDRRLTPEVLVSFQNFKQMNQTDSFLDLKISAEKVTKPNHLTAHKLSFVFTEYFDRLEIELHCNPHLFDSATIEDYLNQYLALLDSVAKNENPQIFKA